MKSIHRATAVVSIAFVVCALPAHAHGNLHRVNHVIIVMQENHSFDNYFGVLPYVPGGPYRAGPCARDDHRCVDGLTCERQVSGLRCKNSNLDVDAPGGKKKVSSFNLTNYCPAPDLNHEWVGSHQEANFEHPRHTLGSSPNDGFVRVNDATEQIDTGESSTEDETMGYYDHTDLPFYYGLAQTFAISDRYFSSVVGPTFPNRAYGLAATSFGHLTTAEILPVTPGGYKPLTGTIMDLLDTNGVSWKNFFSDLPTTGIFRGLDLAPAGHQWPVSFLPAFAPAKPSPSAPPNPAFCGLPAVSFVDPIFGFSDPTAENDEHPPTSIKKGESFVSDVVNTLRSSYCWDDSVIFITYDEHGGFYDHVAPPRAPQGGAKNPDGIDPGLCADEFGPEPGTGQNCTASRIDANTLCPDLAAAGPTGPYPHSCPNFDQLGFRVPFMAVSPFSKPRYVSHTIADHTSMLAFIEKRFLSTRSRHGEDDDEVDDDDERGRAGNSRLHLTRRDQFAATLEDLFDFDKAPSANVPVPSRENDARCQQ